MGHRKKMTDWIFLSKENSDEYVNMFAQGCKTKTTDTNTFDFEESTNPLVLRGILKKKIIHKCWRQHRDFYYIDSGYFGNEPTDSNPHGWKYWHRIVKNDLQHGKILNRPDNRFKQFNKPIESWKRNGRKILVAVPDDKPMKFYDIDLEQWIDDTVKEIKQHTDRPVEVRRRAPERLDRIKMNTLREALEDDVFALVTFNSVAAVESVFQGIPTFTLAPSNADSPVALQDLSKIEKPFYPDDDLRYQWACHLAYGQFHVSELKSGKAKEMLEELE